MQYICVYIDSFLIYLIDKLHIFLSIQLALQYLSFILYSYEGRATNKIKICIMRNNVAVRMSRGVQLD